MRLLAGGVLKARLIKRKITTIRGLKSAVREELKNISDEMRQNALRAWPRRLMKIYKAKGHHILNK